jgi:hypothetical protein
LGFKKEERVDILVLPTSVVSFPRQVQLTIMIKSLPMRISL